MFVHIYVLTNIYIKQWNLNIGMFNLSVYCNKYFILDILYGFVYYVHCIYFIIF